MLVEINLLKEKQKRDITNIIIIIASALLLSVVLYVLYIQLISVQAQTTNLEQEIQETKLLSSQLEQQIAEDLRTDFDDLVKTVDILETYFVPASDALAELVTLLPERGFFYKYMYENSGEIQLQVIFDTIEDVAGYTYMLDSSEIVKNVTISSIDSKYRANPRFYRDTNYKFESDILDSKTEHDYIPDRALIDYQEFLGEDYMSGGHVSRYFVFINVELDMEAVKKLRDES